jgi:hypothetical protein
MNSPRYRHGMTIENRCHWKARRSGPYASLGPFAITSAKSPTGHIAGRWRCAIGTGGLFASNCWRFRLIASFANHFRGSRAEAHPQPFAFAPSRLGPISLRLSRTLRGHICQISDWTHRWAMTMRDRDRRLMSTSCGFCISGGFQSDLSRRGE